MEGWLISARLTSASVQLGRTSVLSQARTLPHAAGSGVRVRTTIEDVSRVGHPVAFERKGAHEAPYFRAMRILRVALLVAVALLGMGAARWPAPRAGAAQ